MPELPEVEIASRHLRSWWACRCVEQLDIPRTRVVRGQAPAAFAVLLGLRLVDVERRGKWMLLSFEGGHGLLSHLGMTGKWVRRKASAPKTPHARATFLLDDAHALDYRDPRLFGRLEVGPLQALRQRKALLELGPEPLESLDVPRLHDALHATRRSLKEALMDQRLLAGLGNIHVGESLFRARLNPERPAGLARGDLRPRPRHRRLPARGHRRRGRACADHVRRGGRGEHVPRLWARGGALSRVREGDPAGGAGGAQHVLL